MYFEFNLLTLTEIFQWTALDDLGAVITSPRSTPPTHTTPHKDRNFQSLSSDEAETVHAIRPAWVCLRSYGSLIVISP